MCIFKISDVQRNKNIMLSIFIKVNSKYSLTNKVEVVI